MRIGRRVVQDIRSPIGETRIVNIGKSFDFPMMGKGLIDSIDPLNEECLGLAAFSTVTAQRFEVLKVVVFSMDADDFDHRRNSQSPGEHHSHNGQDRPQMQQCIRVGKPL